MLDGNLDRGRAEVAGVLTAVLAVAITGELERRCQLETHAATEATAGNKILIWHLDVLLVRVQTQITAARTRFVAAMSYR